MADLLELVDAYFTRLVHPFEDVTSHQVGEAAFFPGAPELPPVDVVGVEFSWFGDTLPRHVGTGVPPAGVEPRAVGSCRCIGQVETVSKLAASN